MTKCFELNTQDVLDISNKLPMTMMWIINQKNVHTSVTPTILFYLYCIAYDYPFSRPPVYTTMKTRL